VVGSVSLTVLGGVLLVAGLALLMVPVVAFGTLLARNLRD